MAPPPNSQTAKQPAAMRPLPPPTYQAEAAAYMVARTANRQRFAALTATLGSANEARAALRTRAAKQRARAKAAQLGLAYWPALMEPLGVDPRAFVAAEAILAPLHGLWNPPTSHGGWDSQGHHGVSAGGQKANSHLPSIVSYTDATHQWVLASTNVQP